MKRNAKLQLASLVAVGACLVASASPAFAGGKAAGSGGKPTHSGGSSSLYVKDLTTGVDHATSAKYGDTITFDVSTTATSEPHVSLQCTQNGAVVYTTQTGYFASYPWPWTQNMTLSSGAWTGGAASCSARLYSLSNSGSSTTLATMTFPVNA